MFDKRLLRIAEGTAPLVALGVALRCLALAAFAACVLGVGDYLQLLYDDAAAARARTAAVAARAAVCAAACLACSAGASYAGSRASSLAKRRVRTRALAKLVGLGPSYRERVEDARASALLGEGTERLGLYVGSYLPQLFYAALGPLLLFCMLAPTCLPAALAMLACVPLMPVCIARTMRRAKREAGAYWDSYVDLGGQFLEALRGLVTLKAYGADAAWHERLRAAAEGFRATTMGLLSVQLRAVKVMDLVAFGGAALGTAMALALMAAGRLGLGGAFSVCALAFQFFMPMRRLGSLFHTGMNARSAIDQLAALMDAPEPARGASLPGDRTSPAAQDGPALVCRSAGYRYPDGRAALEGVDFEARPGSYVGVTGLSGAGKSTLAALVCGRLAGYEGSVTIGGVEARDLDPAELHRTVTYVGSDAHVFKGTIRSNLQMAREDASDANMWEALRRCKLDRYALEEGGLDAEVAEGGANLSAGQRQRLCFARAILHDTPVYVFDEATSSVDAEAEEDLLECVSDLTVSRTVVIVTHRLATLRWCDEVYVLEAGRVAERGGHDELVRRGGRYAGLWAQQMQLERLARAGEDAGGRVEIVRPSEAPQPVTEEMYELASRMPRRIASLMLHEVEMAPIVSKITGAPARMPLGHPSWIPIGDAKERPGEAASATGAAASGGAAGAQAEAGEDGAAQGADGSADAAQARGPEAREPGDLEALRRLARLARGRGGRAGGPGRAALLGLLATACSCAIPVLAGVAIALAARGALAPATLAVVCALVLLAGLARGPLRYRERLATHDRTFRTLAALRDEAFGAMRRLAPAKLEERGSADLLSLLTTDIELLQRFFTQVGGPVASALAAGAAVVAGVSVLASPALGAAALAALLLIGAAVPLASARALSGPGRRARALAADMDAFVLECLQGLPEIVQFGWGERIVRDMDSRSKGLSADERALARRTAWAQAAPAAVTAAALGAMACAGGALGMGGAASGALAACLLALLAASGPAGEAAGLGTSLHQTVAAARRVLALLDEEPAVRENTGGAAPREFTGAAFEGVTFGYGEGPVIEDATLRVEPGEVTRIVGASGAGKSTAVKLLMRFWDPEAGRVTLSGVDLRDMDSAALRAMEGYLPQRTFLFSGTLRDNLSFVKPDATEAELAEAVRRASLDELVGRLPQGLDTPVGDVDGGLSDGELQRLGLARLFLHDAPLMLLDEPTSNLDVLNEALVMRALAVECDDKTIVLVSHRPSAAAIADVTYVMNANAWQS